MTAGRGLRRRRRAQGRAIAAAERGGYESFANSSAVRDSNSNPTTGSPPTTHASWPGSMTYAWPGAVSCSVPSSWTTCSQATRRLAWTYEELGDLERAGALQEDILRRARASRDEFLQAKALSALAQYALDEGRVDQAVVSNLQEAHRFYREKRTHENRYWQAVLVCRFARALALEGHATTAAELLGCFEALVEDMRSEFATGQVESWVRRMNDKTFAEIRTRLDESSITAALNKGGRHTADEAVALAGEHLG
jgi:hypothetical protein